MYKCNSCGVLWEFRHPDFSAKGPVRKFEDGIYPERRLIPFAKRDDCDDIACFDAMFNEKVFIIHDFASSGYEQREVFDSVWEWLRYAINIMIEYEMLEMQ